MEDDIVFMGNFNVLVNVQRVFECAANEEINCNT